MRIIVVFLSIVVIHLGGCATSQEYQARKIEIAALSSKIATKIKIISDFKDGGSSQIQTYIDGRRYEFYIDNRIDTRTQGEVYDIYPSDKDAIMLDPDSPLASSIKKQYVGFPY